MQPEQAQKKPAATILCDIECRACGHWCKGRFAVGEVVDYQGGGACPRCYSTSTVVRIPCDHSKDAS